MTARSAVKRGRRVCHAAPHGESPAQWAAPGVISQGTSQVKSQGTSNRTTLRTTTRKSAGTTFRTTLRTSRSRTLSTTFRRTAGATAGTTRGTTKCTSQRTTVGKSVETSAGTSAGTTCGTTPCPRIIAGRTGGHDTKPCRADARSSPRCSAHGYQPAAEGSLRTAGGTLSISRIDNRLPLT